MSNLDDDLDRYAMAKSAEFEQAQAEFRDWYYKMAKDLPEGIILLREELGRRGKKNFIRALKNMPEPVAEVVRNLALMGLSQAAFSAYDRFKNERDKRVDGTDQ